MDSIIYGSLLYCIIIDTLKKREKKRCRNPYVVRLSEIYPNGGKDQSSSNGINESNQIMQKIVEDPAPTTNEINQIKEEEKEVAVVVEDSTTNNQTEEECEDDSRMVTTFTRVTRQFNDESSDLIEPKSSNHMAHKIQEEEEEEEASTTATKNCETSAETASFHLTKLEQTAKDPTGSSSSSSSAFPMSELEVTEFKNAANEAQEESQKKSEAEKTIQVSMMKKSHHLMSSSFTNHDDGGGENTSEIVEKALYSECVKRVDKVKMNEYLMHKSIRLLEKQMRKKSKQQNRQPKRYGSLDRLMREPNKLAFERKRFHLSWMELNDE